MSLVVTFSCIVEGDLSPAVRALQKGDWPRYAGLLGLELLLFVLVAGACCLRGRRRQGGYVPDKVITLRTGAQIILHGTSTRGA